ncbi:MAG: hypothetical protein M3P51_18645 [Chloroflexota bacterium]|nr:hypothetical protein [Chloroflexota bacterium]
MEYQSTDYGHDESVCEELRHAVGVRHWPPERLAEATSIPPERVERHLDGQEEPRVEELTRYSAALGMSPERLKARAAKEGVGDAREDPAASLPAAKQLLEEAWAGATHAERERLLEHLERLAGQGAR